MNLEISKTGTWHRFSIQLQDRWTPSTFFPELDIVMARIKEHLNGKKEPAVVFDLSQLEGIDSSMITVIVQTVRIVSDRKISIIAPNSDVYTWLSLLGIDRLSDLYESEKMWREKNNIIP